MIRGRRLIYLVNLLDHFDTALYGLMVPILAPLFFPEGEPTAQWIKGYAIFLLGIVCRPLGAYCFSIMAERFSPQYALLRTLEGISVATVGFVLIDPGWGIWATAALALLKSSQNFFSSGEVAVASILVLEDLEGKEQHPSSGRFLSSSMIGIGLATICSSILFRLADPTLYWKWPFFLSAVAAIVSYWLRKKSSIEVGSIRKERLSTIDWRTVFRLIPITGASYVFYVLPMLFFTSFAAAVTSYSLPTLVASNDLMIIVDIFLLLVWGKLFKNQEAIPLLKTVAAIAIVLIPTIFLLLPHSSLSILVIFRIFLIMIGTAFAIPLYRYYRETVPSFSSKYLTVALGYAFGSELLGRSFPAVALILWQYRGAVIAPALYATAIVAISYLILDASTVSKKALVPP